MGADPLLGDIQPSESTEWLEADGLGGFASGTTLGLNTRRYHTVLLVALEPPAGRHVLVNDAVVWPERDGRRQPLSSHRFAPDLTRVAEPPPNTFRALPWPCFETELEGVRMAREVVVLSGLPLVVCSWRLSHPLPGAQLCVRPLLSGRTFPALHHENASCQLNTERDGEQLLFRPYASLPAVRCLANAVFTAEPDWYRSFEYRAERERGFESVEDLVSPGVLRFDLQGTVLDWILAADTPGTRAFLAGRNAAQVAAEVRAREAERRSHFATPLERAAAAYVVRRGTGQTLIAGYPWFGDWGRDTFIALRGICLATGRWRVAVDILLAWSAVVSEGMLPNRFPDDPARL